MHGEVVRTTQLTPSLVRVVLGGAGLDGFEPSPHADSYVNMMFLPAGAGYDAPFDDEAVRELPREQRPYPRRYTVRHWDASRRELSVDFVAHGDEGLAGPWAQRAVAGDRIQFRGPGGGWSPDPDADWHLFVGDESALPAIAVGAERVGAGVPVVVVLVVDGPDDELPLESPGELSVTWVHRGADLTSAVQVLELPPGRGAAFVHGEAAETREVRRHLLSSQVVARAGLSASPYWRRGQTDEQWRSVKSAWQREVELDVP